MGPPARRGLVVLALGPRVRDARDPRRVETLREAKAARRSAIEASEEGRVRMVQIGGRRAAGGLPDSTAPKDVGREAPRAPREIDSAEGTKPSNDR